MAATFSEWVRRRTDDELVALLAARPDLGTPAPSSLRSLAARAASRTSTERAVAHLDAGALQVLEALVALTDDGAAGEQADDGESDASPDGVPNGSTNRAPVGAAMIAAAVGAPDATSDVERALDAARTAALVWGTGDGLSPAPGLAEVLGPYPAGLGPTRPQRARPEADQAADPRNRSAAEQQVLDALAWGPPVGVVPPGGTPPRQAVDALVAAGLLLRGDTRHVLLPRDVGLALRAGRTHRSPALAPPRPAGREVPRASIDAEAATAALEIVRLTARLVTAWDDDPPRTLRAGGLAVRDLRRTAQALETDEATTTFVVETAASAGLVADDGDSPAAYAVTVRADRWEDGDDAARWADLVRAWTTSRRTPWQVGSRDERGTVRAPLSTDLHRPWVPRLRAQVLDVLAAQPGVALGLDDVLEVLRWRSPRAVPPEAAVAGLLREATLLGVTGAGALSAPGLAALDGPAGSEGPAGATGAAWALRGTLPAEVHEILLQGDLTGIVPGRPASDLARLVDLAADVESRGAALTVRFSTASVTRALDHGSSGEELLAELAARSPVPVPQPLEYLVKDTARRHEALRVGAATSYVRAADATVLAGLAEDPRLASLGLVRLAPTVLAASVPPAELHEVLREHGLLSALEGPDGRAVGRRHSPRRLDRDAWSRRTAGPVRTSGTDARAAVVARLRGNAGGAAAPDDAGTASEPGVGVGPDAAAEVASTVSAASASEAVAGAVGQVATDPGDALAVLSEALRDGRTVWVEMVGRSGGLERRELKPLKLDGGRLRALDARREAELTIAVHRIASVQEV
jgi:hypothetical protein